MGVQQELHQGDVLRPHFSPEPRSLASFAQTVRPRARFHRGSSTIPGGVVIIGVSGEASSGKDTTSEHIQQYSFAPVAFADPIKRYCREIYNFSIDQLWGPSHMRNEPDHRYPRAHGPWVKGKCACCGVEDLGPDRLVLLPCFLTPRFALQRLGSEWARDCFQDTWASYGLRLAKTLLSGGYVYSGPQGLQPLQHDTPYKGVAFSDVRFLNEMTHIRSAGGLLLRVRRPVTSRLHDTTHRSEAEQRDVPDSYFDAVIFNDGTLPELYTKIDMFMEAQGCRK